MSKPILLVFLLVILIVTSQFEWRQPPLVDLDSATSLSQKQQQISDREEAVKEKVLILNSFMHFFVSPFFKRFKFLALWLSFRRKKCLPLWRIYEIVFGMVNLWHRSVCVVVTLMSWYFYCCYYTWKIHMIVSAKSVFKILGLLFLESVLVIIWSVVFESTLFFALIYLIYIYGFSAF